MINSKLITDLTEELNNTLAGGRIDKIQQPAKGIILLNIRCNFYNYKLLISSYPGKARMHITDNSFEIPAEPPMFCMLLRKHLQGCRIIAFEQLNNDKVILIKVSGIDELSRNSTKYLIVEMIGRMPNIILTDDSMHIIDCIYRRDFRNPGLIYRTPEIPENYKTYNEEYIRPDNISKTLDKYYTRLEIDDVYKSKSKQLRTILNNTIKRTEKKLGSRLIELSKTKSRDEIRIKADLIKANLWKINKGDTILRCENYFNDNAIILIDLDPNLSPQKYITKLYKEYNKLKNAELHLTDLIKEAEDQLYFLNSEADLLSRAKSDKEIDDINQELILQGFIKQSKSNKKKTTNSSAPGECRTQSGKTVLIGKNNVQNENLTFKTANKNDYWFHSKDYHGSHVILCCNGAKPTNEDIIESAKIAADNSQAHGNCYVDYTLVKNVKKQKGAYPGKVIYTDYSSIKID